MDSGIDTQNLPWLEFENEKLTWRELFLLPLPVRLVLHLFLGCLGQHIQGLRSYFESGGADK